MSARASAAEARDLADEDVAVAVEALVAAAREQQRLAAHDGAEALVHLRRQDQVHLRVLVLEQHEDDAVRRRGPLPRDDHAGDGDARAVRLVEQLDARQRSRPAGAGAAARADARRSRGSSSGSPRASAPTPSAPAGPASPPSARAEAPAASPRRPNPGPSARAARARAATAARGGRRPKQSHAPDSTSATSSSRDSPVRCARSRMSVNGAVRVPLGDDRLRVVLPHALDVRQADAHRAVLDVAAGSAARSRRAAASPRRAAARRARASTADRSPSAARSSATRGTPPA